MYINEMNGSLVMWRAEVTVRDKNRYTNISHRCDQSLSPIIAAARMSLSTLISRRKAVGGPHIQNRFHGTVELWDRLVTVERG